jgi:ribosomal protein L7/L12
MTSTNYFKKALQLVTAPDFNDDRALELFRQILLHHPAAVCEADALLRQVAEDHQTKEAASLQDEILAILRRPGANLIAAVKHYRSQVRGSSLAEALAFVRALQAEVRQ